MRVAASARSASAQTMFAALEPSSPMNFFAPGGAGELVAGGGAAGHGDDGNQRMGGEQLRGLAPARHHVEQPVGHARRLHRFRHQQRHLGPGRRRLHHDGVADGQRRRDLLDQQIGGPVERRDGGDHAIGNAGGEAEAAGARRGYVERQYLAVEMRHLRDAGAQEDADPLGLEGRGAPRLADEADERADDLALDPVDGVGRRQQPLDALGGGRILMLEEGFVRVPDRGIDHPGVGFDHVRGDGLVDRANERRGRGVGRNGPADPRHQLRFGHRASSSIFCTCLIPTAPINDRHPEVRASKDERPRTRGDIWAVVLRGPACGRAPQDDGRSVSFAAAPVATRAGPRSSECRAACSVRTALRA